MGKFVVGNWKMYKTQQQAGEFIESFAKSVRADDPSDSWVGLAVPFTLIGQMHSLCRDFNCPLHIGAQNMHSAEQGAFTGEIALEMLLEQGAQFAILGHSERRRHFLEDDAFINLKVKRALSRKFRAIVCIGDTKEQQQEGRAIKVLHDQLDKTLAGISQEEAALLMIAYEPVWAIGTGQIASPDLIEKAHRECRSWLLKRFPDQAIPLLYGGSVTEANAAEIRSIDQVDGILVGGGSLSAQEFAVLKNHFFK